MQAVLSLHVFCVIVWLVSTLIDTTSERFIDKSANVVATVLGRVGLTLGLLAFLGVLITGGRLAGLSPATLSITLKIATGLMAQGLLVHALLARDRLALTARRRSDGRESFLAFVAVAVAASVGVHLWIGA